MLPICSHFNPSLSASVLPHSGLFMSHLNMAAACPKARRVLPTLQANGAVPSQTPFKGTRDKVMRSKLASVEYRLFTTSLSSLPLASHLSPLPCLPSPCTPSPDILKNPPSSGICCMPGFLSRLIILSVDSLSFFSSFPATCGL